MSPTISRPRSSCYLTPEDVMRSVDKLTSPCSPPQPILSYRRPQLHRGQGLFSSDPIHPLRYSRQKDSLVTPSVPEQRKRAPQRSGLSPSPLIRQKRAGLFGWFWVTRENGGEKSGRGERSAADQRVAVCGEGLN